MGKRPIDTINEFLKMSDMKVSWTIYLFKAH